MLSEPPNCNQTQEKADFCIGNQQGTNKLFASIPADLHAVVKAWPFLPENIRAAILSLCQKEPNA